QDITERKTAEVHWQFRAEMLDTIDIAVVASTGDLRVTEWNGAAERLYGWTRDEVIGTSLLDLQTIGADEERPQLRGHAGDWERELMLRRKDGTEFAGWTRIRVLRDDAGEPRLITGVSMALSARGPQ
ncbi:MAG: PAS domain-containing protein, partial [Solirubrobacteraceae bacterium]|nr:PAS domain-containing protein [Solirubrobacteraceae bacterium]